MRLINGDCIEELQSIESGSVNLIVTDPPYNIGKAEWDKIPNYIEWCGEWLKECERVLKDNGSIYIFHNDITQIAQLMTWIDSNTEFKYNSFCIWHKPNFRALAWRSPSEKNTLRCWFNVCEYCLVYVKAAGSASTWDRSGRLSVMLDPDNFKPLRAYFEKVQKFTGLNKKQIITRVGQCADHCFRWNSPQWTLPTAEAYQKIVDEFGLETMEEYRSYEGLLQEYERLRLQYEKTRYVHNLDNEHCNVWTSAERNDGKLHPTQKPLDILERIIKTSSNPGDVVLDPFLGSGSTGVAALNTGREFIGIEKDNNYFEIASERINTATAQRSFLLEEV